MSVRDVVLSGKCRNPGMQDIITWLPSRRADHRIPYGIGPVQFGDLWLPRSEPGPKGHPVVISIHGGGWQCDWSHEYQDRLAEGFSDAGIVVWNIEFRRVGNTAGGFPGTFEDVAAAVEHLRVLAKDYPLDLDRVVAVGHSSGAHLVAWLAARNNLTADSPVFASDALPLRGVVELAPMPDLTHLEFYDGIWPGLPEIVMGVAGAESDEEFVERLPQVSPRHMGPASMPRTLIIGDLDEIPVEYVMEQARLAREAGAHVQTIVFEGANHFDLVDPGGGAWDMVTGSVLELLEGELDR